MTQITPLSDANSTSSNPTPFDVQHLPPHSAPDTTTAILADTSPGPFEGPEKLLEIWFAPSAEELPDVRRTIGSGLKYRPNKASNTKLNGNGDSSVQYDHEHNAKASQTYQQCQWKGLRKVRRGIWEDMLKVVKCQVLSVIEGEDVDAYLLSESSLFVMPHLIILKTCGTTINLLGLTRIIEIAREFCGFDDVYRCFYSRKSFFFPERQIGPHRGWKEEVDYLDGVFNHAGAAYTVGPMNRDHWLLYLTSPPPHLAASDASSSIHSPRLEQLEISPSSNVHHGTGQSSAASTSASSAISSGGDIPIDIQYRPAVNGRHDQTLEILMTHLSPDARAPFFHPTDLDPSFCPDATQARSGHHLGSTLTKHLGIDQLFDQKETTIDSFGFEPCGYSANAIIGSGLEHNTTGLKEEEAEGGGEKGKGYFTIHVTPEEGWSFASFECNVSVPFEASENSSVPDVKTLIRKVVDIFQPGRLSITLFISTDGPQVGGLPLVDMSASTSTLGDIVIETEATRRAWMTFSRHLLGDLYVRKDRIGYEFEGYDLVFACFEKRGFVPNGAAASDPRGIRGI